MSGPGRRRTRRLRTLLWISVGIVLALGAAELVAQAYWNIHFDVRMFHPSRILDAYYPEIRKVEALRPTRDDPFYDVLLLGASTLHRNYGPVELALREELARRGQRRVRTFNLAVPAQTSRDSRLKYQALEDARFELVLFYDGLNEARANNAPPEVFRENYDHYAWYETIHALAPHHGRAAFALPYTLRYLAVRIQQASHAERYIGTQEPRADWLPHGASARSADSLRQNLNAILDTAARRGDQVLLLTFAHHIPADYSRSAFSERRLDYSLHLSPIEIWGEPAHVAATLVAHNDVIRSLAGSHEEVWFLDMAGSMPGSALYFNDICHFTVVGATKFADDLVAFLIPKLESH